MNTINKKYFIKNSPEHDEKIVYKIPYEYVIREYKDSEYLLNKNNHLTFNVCKIFHSYIDNENNKYNTFNNNSIKKRQFIQKPKLNKIINFIQYIYDHGYIEPECIIILLIYIERLIDNGKCNLQPNNWKIILFCSLIIASKIIDDYTMENTEFSEYFPQYELQYINKMEKNYLQMINYKVHIDNDTYAKYYYYLYNKRG
jgi:hypothetical protein